MARRTINSPGVEIGEVDLSLRTPSPAGTTVYMTGYTDQGPSDEVIRVTSLTEFERIYGLPKTPAERYFYHSVKAAFSSSANIIVNRLPYGSNSGEGFGNSVSILAYPARVATLSSGNNDETLITTNFNTTSGTILIGSPTQFVLTTADYIKLKNNTLFTWSTSAATSFNSVGSLSGAALIIINKGQTVIDGKGQGYYVGLADNTNVNPASNYDGIGSVKTVTSTAPAAGLSSFTTMPTSRFEFSLTATPAFGSNPKTGTISQIMEEKVTGYDTSIRAFDDTLNVGIFKLRQSVFSNDANTLAYVVEDTFNGSIGYHRQVTSDSGGLPVNFSLESVSNRSRDAEIIVNPYIADYFEGLQVDSIGNPTKKIRIISEQLKTAMSTASLVGLGTTALSGARLSAVGCTFGQLTAAEAVIGKGDSLFPHGSYGEVKVASRVIGDIPTKLLRAVDRVRNDELYDIDIVAEAGLGTIYTTMCATSLDYFDDLKTADSLEALRTSNDLTTPTARDNYNTVFNIFNVFCGPVKDGGRGDVLFIADPLRQIFVTGKNNKVINAPTKNFTVDVYWALRHQFETANTSYSTVYANYMKVYDTQSGQDVWVPPSGFVAAKMASSDADVGPWVAPAGFNRGVISNVLDVAISPNQRQRDELYKISTNPIASFPDQGIIIFGQKTLLKKPSAFDRINVRRAFLYLEKAVKSTVKFFLFENNTLYTRTRVINTLTPFFERVKSSQGIYDYLIVCDQRNNTETVIDNNELVVDIYIKPVKSAEFILVNFYATRTDTKFEELVGG